MDSMVQALSELSTTKVAELAWMRISTNLSCVCAVCIIPDTRAKATSLTMHEYTADAPVVLY